MVLGRNHSRMKYCLVYSSGQIKNAADFPSSFLSSFINIKFSLVAAPRPLLNFFRAIDKPSAPSSKLDLARPVFLVNLFLGCARYHVFIPAPVSSRGGLFTTKKASMNSVARGRGGGGWYFPQRFIKVRHHIPEPRRYLISFIQGPYIHFYVRRSISRLEIRKLQVHFPLWTLSWSCFSVNPSSTPKPTGLFVN